MGAETSTSPSRRGSSGRAFRWVSVEAESRRDTPRRKSRTLIPPLFILSASHPEFEPSKARRSSPWGLQHVSFSREKVPPELVGRRRTQSPMHKI
ncbi:hypothetical protein OIU84_029817 [Salix udensis]|uniref:Uncharacterized protein n=1 Tax=Salix udensis TaxID=889485 RepID=A0AAD6P8Q9_9ROSI|nr:hypothetical protein OIU84_029817 [Salix udensis]